MTIPTALTIAGSDSSGGAGIQADLKTFSRLKVYGTSVVTALTAQNSMGIQEVMEIPAGFVAAQIDSVLSDIPAASVKTGMLARAAIVEIVAAKLRQYGVRKLVVDPVMTATVGSSLLHTDAIEALRRQLLPLALIVTPNLDEARRLAGCDIHTPDDMEQAALTIHSFGSEYVLVKGGHLEGPAVDVLFDGNSFVRFESDRIVTKETHGTGCVLSAAIASYLACGKTVPAAVRMAKEIVTEGIRHGLKVGKGNGSCDPVGIEEV